MPQLLLPLLAVIAIMATGALCNRILPRPVEGALNQYVYFLAFPAILFISLAATPFNDIINPGFVFGYLGAMVITYFTVYRVYCSSEGKAGSAAIRALAATFGNTAFIGIPVLMALYPGSNTAMMAAAVASLLSVLMFAVSVVQLKLVHESLPPIQRLWLIAKVVGKNPIVLGSALGVWASYLALQLPEAVETTIRVIGQSSSPCALFAIGIALARSLKEPPLAERVLPFWPINLAKLAIQPLLALALLTILGVSTELLAMGVLLAAMPTAASVYLLAYRHQTLEKQTARGIVTSTVLTLLSLPALAIWLKLIV
ncbi:AEC family transporter [Shewanella sp.]|uniref:AEC family transporter n=1 Tax=Shewanella sp. TaxID=50422 RepID=UPI0035668BD3